MHNFVFARVFFRYTEIFAIRWIFMVSRREGCALKKDLVDSKNIYFILSEYANRRQPRCLICTSLYSSILMWHTFWASSKFTLFAFYFSTMEFYLAPFLFPNNGCNFRGYKEENCQILYLFTLIELKLRAFESFESRARYQQWKASCRVCINDETFIHRTNLAVI